MTKDYILCQLKEHITKFDYDRTEIFLERYRSKPVVIYDLALNSEGTYIVIVKWKPVDDSWQKLYWERLELKRLPLKKVKIHLKTRR